jgi:hypothetical protein
MVVVQPTAFFCKVVVESPYAGDVDRNMKYLRACFQDCLTKHEAPIASHKLYTDIPACQDDIPDHRDLGIVAGYAWGVEADKVVVYTNFGISGGMQKAIDFYTQLGMDIEYRQIPRSMLIEWDL